MNCFVVTVTLLLLWFLYFLSVATLVCCCFTYCHCLLLLVILYAAILFKRDRSGSKHFFFSHSIGTRIDTIYAPHSRHTYVYAVLNPQRNASKYKNPNWEKRRLWQKQFSKLIGWAGRGETASAKTALPNFTQIN